MNSHTPGPWGVDGWDIVTDSRPHKTVARICNGGYQRLSLEEIDANARLIAAATELLAALKIAVRALQDHDADEAMAGEFETLTDVIAKAEGRGE